ncbi:DNA (cytosine-5-)-methyltransferase [Desulfohalobium retbaense]|uniref:Cytosine-specific methyltransferase n=1 Tax=Desulfohalobium retbaense (strain ATCC 49708 / DSM 5692 / JCM 16813 / HR100) TaxID=485915 RepID=C8X5V5_DESRD|nr:DNA (cytosine-5-)-methyltransferase [Desulfohalobium retbaense]ACV69802.1 transcriptional regulator, XRE family [Desulfohalobium retbaense DSM 5692]
MNIAGNQLRETRLELGLSQARLAELTGISQHLLSAYELEKSTLAPDLIQKLASTLQDKEQIRNITGRKKRYRNHEYKFTPKQSGRSSRASRTNGNESFINALSIIEKKHANPKGEALNAISLFSGCGGFSLGFSAAGFNVRGFLELDPGLRKIYRLNFPNSFEMGGDITQIQDAKIKNYKSLIGDIDVIIGGPPCQGFSLSGKRDVNDPRNTLFKHYLRFVDAFRPKIAIMENVRLLSSMKNSEGNLVKCDIESDFHNHGYNVQSFEINAKDYGVPQHRERIIFVAVRNDLSIKSSIPDPKFGYVEDLLSNKIPYRTFGDACSDLEFLESGEKGSDVFHAAVRHPSHVIEWLWDVPEGKSAHDNEDPKLRPPSGYNTTYKRQIWDEPASTVQTTFGMISGCRNVHPIATRSLTIREAARIQSFPDSFKLVGRLGIIRTGIGNAVPPLLAYELGEHFKEFLNFVEVPSL